jgi:hypothetical protein
MYRPASLKRRRLAPGQTSQASIALLARPATGSIASRITPCIFSALLRLPDLLLLTPCAAPLFAAACPFCWHILSCIASDLPPSTFLLKNKNNPWAALPRMEHKIQTKKQRMPLMQMPSLGTSVASSSRRSTPHSVWQQFLSVQGIL